MKRLRNRLLTLVPSRVAERLGYMLLRTSRGEHRAFTELFVPPYCSWVAWNSGLGAGLHALYGLCRAIRPTVVVEIGSARGLSTCALALACRQNGNGKVYAIDPHTVNGWTDQGNGSETLAFLVDRLNDYELAPWCRVIQSTSAEVAVGWSRPIDLFFIDGDHTYEGIRNDFESFQPWLRDHSLVVFHDTLWENHHENVYYRADIGVPRFLDDLRAKGFHLVTLDAFPGLTLLSPVLGGRRLCPDRTATGVAGTEP